MTEIEELDIIGNIKLIDNYKNYLLSSLADLFMTMGKGSRMDMEETQQEISEIIMLSYLLGKKLGISFQALDETAVRRLKLSLSDEAKIEKQLEEYTSLMTYLKKEHIE